MTSSVNCLNSSAWCIAIGHPGGYKLGRTPVVRVGRILDVGKAMIQTDCTLVGGDSGGPLFDMFGRVIGINSRIGPNINYNIHVPVDTYHDTWDKLVVWGWRDDEARKLVVVNLGETRAEGHVSLPWDDLRGQEWRLADGLSDAVYERSGDDLRDGLYVALDPWGSNLFDLTPLPPED